MKRLCTGICILSLLAACLAAGAQAGSNRIAFLDIRMANGEMTLERIKVVEGKLKVPGTLHLARGKLYCEVLDISGRRLYETVIPDPSIHRFEYADEDGRIHSKTVTREDAFISVRIPYDAAAWTMEIYRIDSQTGRRELLKRAERIGSLRIDSGRGGHE